MKVQLGSVIEAVLVLCAVTVTAVTVLGRPRAAVESTVQHITDWQRLQVSRKRIGPVSAPFVLVVWTDYECPACAREELEFEQLRVRLGDSLAIVYHHFPVAEIHGSAMHLATVAECSVAQGQFERVHRLIFSRTLARDPAPLSTIAAAIPSVDTAALRECSNSQAATAAVDAELQLGHTLGIRGTPTLLIRDRLQLGGLTAEQLEGALRESH